MTAPAIAVRGLSKRFPSVLALNRVSLEVHRGEVYALLGLNGAGKTTLIRTLLGMVRPSSGEVEVLGRPVTDRAVWARVGYLVETASAYPELTVLENLEVTRRLRKVGDPSAVDEVVGRFGLGPYADRRAGTLSLGNAQRLGLAKALLARPPLILLDEPVNGLDPSGVVEVRDLLIDLAREQGVTVFLSSHNLAEVARIATRIGVLHDGRLVDGFDAAALATRVRARLEVDARDPLRAAAALRAAGLVADRTHGGLVLEADWAVGNPELVATLLVRAGEPPTRLAVVEEDLESYFLRLVGSSVPARGASDDG